MRICWVTQCPLQTGYCLSPKTPNFPSYLDFVFVWHFCFALHPLKNKFDWLSGDLQGLILIHFYLFCTITCVYYAYIHIINFQKHVKYDEIWFYSYHHILMTKLWCFILNIANVLSKFHHIWFWLSFGHKLWFLGVWEMLEIDKHS